MRNFFAENLASTESRVVLIGSDTPDLPVEYVHRAFDLLVHCQVVVGPSLDGGYYLIGIKNEVPDVFDGIQWSTEHVFSETIDRLDKGNISYGLLPQLDDVDELDDLNALLSRLRNSQRDALQDELLKKLDQLELNNV